MSRTRRRTAGVTILETVIAMVTVIVLVGMVTGGVGRAYGTWRGTATQTKLDRNANAAIETIVSSLRSASATSVTTDLAPPSGGPAITFRSVTGYASDAVTLGELTTISWATDPNEPRDGQDNDGDGLIDEGVISIVRGDSTPVIITRQVAEYLDGEVANNADDNGNGLRDEQGLSFDIEDGTLTIRVTLQAINGDGELITSSAESAFRLQ